MSLNSAAKNSADVATNGGDDAHNNSDHHLARDPHGALGVDEIVNEEEARRRREQLNRRPSYRMILKDLETVGDKPMKKEMEENNSAAEFAQQQQQASAAGARNEQQQQQQQQRPMSIQQIGTPNDSANFANANSGGLHGAMPTVPGGLKPVGNLASAGGALRIGVGTAANQIANISPPTQQLSLGQLNLITSPSQQGGGGRLVPAEMPSQPPPLSANAVAPPPQPLLAAVNNLEMLGLKAPDSLAAAFTPNEGLLLLALKPAFLKTRSANDVKRILMKGYLHYHTDVGKQSQSLPDTVPNFDNETQCRNVYLLVNAFEEQKNKLEAKKRNGSEKKLRHADLRNQLKKLTLALNKIRNDMFFDYGYCMDCDVPTPQQITLDFGAKIVNKTKKAYAKLMANRMGGKGKESGVPKKKKTSK